MVYVKKVLEMNFDKESFVDLSNSLAECKFSLFGGNIMSFRPKNHNQDVFWMGNLNKFDNVHAIRGGVPVCWPRFAEEKLNDNLPRHGFARLLMWNVDELNVGEDETKALFSLNSDKKYGLDIEAKLFVKVTDKLECVLETVNNGVKTFDFSEALHAYFNVGDKDKIVLKGFEEHKYHSSLDGKAYDAVDDLQIKGEFDAAFYNHEKSVKIVDETYKRVITVNKQGSKSTVVWNPNKDLAEMSQGQYRNFVCIEPANQGECFVKLAPKEKHKLVMSVEVAKL